MRARPVVSGPLLPHLALAVSAALLGGAGLAAKNIETTTPTDAEFATMMFTTSYQRYLQPISVEDSQVLERENIHFGGGGQTFKYDFRAMGLVEPLAGMYCAGTQVFIKGGPYVTDGEVCVLDEFGRSDFDRLHDRASQAPLV